MMSAMTSLLLALATIVNGLYAGFMLAFLIAVMPGLAELTDRQFTAAMRRFNEKVPGPAFLVLFLGVVALPAAAFFTGLGEHDAVSGPAVLAALVCAVIGHAITVVGNIPLNNALAASEGGDDSAARAAFEPRWSTLHQVRTAFSLVACALLVVAL
ncbi:anthrone oxygenase family protein [Streptomyces californicus]|uniref:anthrone oxygenase family protein n=1 Tax=Streptomyces californicus TaxID=67351 RepID=UPI0033213F32